MHNRSWFIGEITSPILPNKLTRFSFPPMRTLCSTCNDVEAFNLFGDNNTVIISLDKPWRQAFSFTVQCQRCRACVIAFLLKRDGPKIQIVGRSEFEEVQVPAFMAKRPARFYSQAILAFQCGQVLAALFMLRTLIEQHMRTVTNSDTLRGEDLCEEYSKQLGKDVSGQVPSFKEIYGELSNGLHRAEENEDLFEAQREQICIHFQGVEFFSTRRRASKKQRSK